MKLFLDFPTTLTNLQQVSLILSQISPCFYAPYLLRKTNDAFITLSIFEILLLLFPYIFCQLVQKQKKREFFLNELLNRPKQISIGVVILWLLMVAMLIVYAGVLEFKSSWISQLNLPMKFELFYLLSLGFLFGIINPVVEEIYWRIFLVKIYPDDLKHRLLINTFYAAYHFFVVEYIFGWRLGALGACAVFVLGLIIDFVRRKVGLIAAILMHMGLDFAVVMVFADIIFKAMGEIGMRTPAIFKEDNMPLDFFTLS